MWVKSYAGSHRIHNPTLGRIAGQNCNSKGGMLLIVHCSTICNSQDVEATQMFTDRGMDKEDVCVYIYTYTHIPIYGIYTVPLYLYTMEYYSAIEKKEIMPFAAPWGPRDCHTK